MHTQNPSPSDVSRDNLNAASETSQVLIAGGGPTGLWLSCELALQGVRVTVLEQLGRPTGRSKALGLHPRTMEMLDHRGILSRFTDGNPTPPFVNFAMLPLDLRTIDFPHPYGVVIPQARVEQLLEERAQELGVEIRRGHEVTGFRQDEGGVTVGVRTANGDYQVRAAYLVGCDGGHSVVRKQSGVAFPETEPMIVGRMGDVRLDSSALDLVKQNVPELGRHEFGVARTKTGNFAIVPLGDGIFRVAAMEWEHLSFDHNAPMPLEELLQAIQRVIGLNLPMSDPVWLSRATDSSRLVEQYRVARVLLAGDAAHIHWAYGGMGLQTGLQDAGNLGWKLAAQVHGWAPVGLLDSYHTERHRVGERLLLSTRAQEALARPGEHVTALRALMHEFLDNQETLRRVVEMITSVEISYEMADEETEQHPLLGRWAPHLNLTTSQGRIRLADLMNRGRSVLLDLSANDEIQKIGSDWSDRIDSIRARCDEHPANLDAMLIRPDGYVAWVLTRNNTSKVTQSLSRSLSKWFGHAKAAVQHPRAA